MLDAVHAQPDLVARLVAAAAAAVEDQRRSLTSQPEGLRGVVLELELDSAGAIVDGTCYVERRVRTLRGSGARG